MEVKSCGSSVMEGCCERSQGPPRTVELEIIISRKYVRYSYLACISVHVKEERQCKVSRRKKILIGLSYYKCQVLDTCISKGEISDSHGDEYEDGCLLGCCAL
jgi:hypothetical protein